MKTLEAYHVDSSQQRHSRESVGSSNVHGSRVVPGMKRGTSKFEPHLESTDGMGIDERGMFDEVNASGSSRPSFNVKKSATVRSFGKPQP